MQLVQINCVKKGLTGIKLILKPIGNQKEANQPIKKIIGNSDSKT